MIERIGHSFVANFLFAVVNLISLAHWATLDAVAPGGLPLKFILPVMVLHATVGVYAIIRAVVTAIHRDMFKVDKASEERVNQPVG